MPRTGLRRVTLALGAILLATIGISGMPGVTPARAASDLSLNVLPDDGENAIYNFVNSATSSVDVTIYELKDVTLENDLVAREKAGVNVRVILDQAQKSYDTAAYNVLTAGGVGVVWSSTAFTYTHQKTITVNNDESYISTGNFDTTYYATSRDFGVFDTDANDVAAIVAVFNADYAQTSITPSDGDDLVWSPTDSQTHLLALINGAQHSLDVEQEEFSDTTLVNAIVADENRGVTVRVVVEDPSDYTSELNQITAAGGKVTGYSSSTGFYIHAKTIIADYGTSTAKAFAGSENFSSNSLNNNRELGLITSDSGVVSGLESDVQRRLHRVAAPARWPSSAPAPRPPPSAARCTCRSQGERHRDRRPVLRGDRAAHGPVDQLLDRRDLRHRDHRRHVQRDRDRQGLHRADRVGHVHLDRRLDRGQHGDRHQPGQPDRHRRHRRQRPDHGDRLRLRPDPRLQRHRAARGPVD